MNLITIRIKRGFTIKSHPPVVAWQNLWLFPSINFLQPCKCERFGKGFWLIDCILYQVQYILFKVKTQAATVTNPSWVFVFLWEHLPKKSTHTLRSRVWSTPSLWQLFDYTLGHHRSWRQSQPVEGRYEGGLNLAAMEHKMERVVGERIRAGIEWINRALGFFRLCWGSQRKHTTCVPNKQREWNHTHHGVIWELNQEAAPSSTNQNFCAGWT